jgi:hypothetical protein
MVLDVRVGAKTLKGDDELPGPRPVAPSLSNFEEIFP